MIRRAAIGHMTRCLARGVRAAIYQGPRPSPTNNKILLKHACRCSAAASTLAARGGRHAVKPMSTHEAITDGTRGAWRPARGPAREFRGGAVIAALRSPSALSTAGHVKRLDTEVKQIFGDASL